MEYTVITRLGKDEFIEQVNEKIKEGWTPLGGVTTSLIQYEKPAGTEAGYSYACDLQPGIHKISIPLSV